jgi:hypothetical protein
MKRLFGTFGFTFLSGDSRSNPLHLKGKAIASASLRTVKAGSGMLLQSAGYFSSTSRFASSCRLRISGIAIAPIGAWAYCLTAIFFTSCLRELSPDDGCPPGLQPVKVAFHWDGLPASALPKEMRVHFYSEPAPGMFAEDFPVHGGLTLLSPGKSYYPVCYDYRRSTGLLFRGNDSLTAFESYTAAVGEFVSEPAPSVFHTDNYGGPFTVRVLPAGDTLTVHFYPRNVLHEVTFLIYNVSGAEPQNLLSGTGVLTGMSASYYPGTGRLSPAPSGVLTRRLAGIPSGQAYTGWTTAQRELFTRKNPLWQSGDPAAGWIGDWITGTVCVFGLASLTGGAQGAVSLTLRFPSSDGTEASASWYDEAAVQVLSAAGGDGSWDGQQDWREGNGGFDIILDGGGFSIPGGNAGSFDVDADAFRRDTIPVDISRL